MTSHVCQNCDKPFESNLCPAHAKRKPPKYCCHPCAMEGSRKTRVTLTCRQCNCQFQRKKYMQDWSQDRGPFCGFACYALWQSENTKGDQNPSYDPKVHQDLTCDRCGEHFLRPKWVRGGELHFCNRDCFQAFAGEHFRKRMPIHYGKSWRLMRRRAIERDQHQCQDCGSFSELVVHHIQAYKTFENAARCPCFGQSGDAL